MAMESITGLATDLLSEAGIPPSYLAIGGLVIILAIVILTGILFSLIIFIMSCFKHKLRLSELFTNAINETKKIYKKLFPKYIPFIILVSVVLTLSYVISSFDVLTLEILLAFFCLIIACVIYYAVLDSSLAKSYYKSKTNNLIFEWISFGQFAKLFFVGIIYLVLFFLGLPFFMIPSLILGYFITFVRYPIITRDTSIGESFNEGWKILKNNFWDVVFFVTIIGTVTGAANQIFGSVPIINNISSIITLLILQPFGTVFFTRLYKQFQDSEVKH